MSNFLTKNPCPHVNNEGKNVHMEIMSQKRPFVNSLKINEKHPSVVIKRVIEKRNYMLNLKPCYYAMSKKLFICRN